MSLEQDLLNIERQLWTDGPDAYRSHLEPQCLVAFTEMAGPMGREEIAKSADKSRWSGVDLRPKGTAQMADGAAIVTYECTARRSEGEPYRALVSSGYVRRPEGWKLAFHQQTPLK